MDGLINTIRCHVCNTIVKYPPDDVIEDSGDFYVECPCCMNDVIIKQNINNKFNKNNESI